MAVLGEYLRPFALTVVYTRPKMPKGASEITQRTTCDGVGHAGEHVRFVLCDAARSAVPNTTAQARMPM